MVDRKLKLEKMLIRELDSYDKAFSTGFSTILNTISYHNRNKDIVSNLTSNLSESSINKIYCANELMERYNFKTKDRSDSGFVLKMVENPDMAISLFDYLCYNDDRSSYEVDFIVSSYN